MSVIAEMMEPQAASLEVKLAETTAEIEQVFRLRYQVFVEEEKNPVLYDQSGLEMDEYDLFCDHLIVKDSSTGVVCGTYRLLPGLRTEDRLGFYSESEFELHAFNQYRRHTLELGRSCVAPGYRGGRTLQLLWEGIAAYLNQNRHSFLIGCASLHGLCQQEINEIYTMLHRKGVINERYGIKPRETHQVEGLKLLEDHLEEKAVFRRLPPLMKGYQWLGAEIGGVPAYDPIFNTVDFFIILETDKVSKRYQRRFLNASSAVQEDNRIRRIV
ncbi:MAG: GNAT family N-acetyltransferase [Firmicutes bacterium]|nr:GNAT family N-acetyltransferase [Bacillota bacterium]